jgi:PAS domain S-box-containing protein
MWALATVYFTSGFLNRDIYLAGLSHLFSTVSATLFFCFALDFSHQSKWFTKSNVLILILEPFITLLVLISNSRINLIFDTTGAEILPGPWYWINIIYFNTLVASAAYVIIKTFMHGPLPHRLQSGMVVAGAVLILPASLISLSISSPTTAAFVLLFAFTLTGIILSFGLSSYRLLDIVPIPRDVVVERMGDGWMMLDMQNRIVDLNPAAEAVIGIPREKIYGLPAENVLTDWSSIVHGNDKSKELDVRGRINLQNIWRYLNLRVSPLVDSNGRQFGRLILWKDITESKRAEEARQLARDEMFMLLHSISNAASRATNIDEFLEDTIYQIVYSFKSQASVVLLVEETVNTTEPKKLTLNAHHGFSPKLVERLSLLSERDSLVSSITRNNSRVVIPDLLIKSDLQEAILEAGYKSMVFVPISIQRQVLGIIGLARNELPVFDSEEIARLDVVADEIATFIHSDRQRQLSIALAERQRLVRDLHDSTTQKLYGLLTLTEAAQAGIEMGSPEKLAPILSRIGETARQALKDMRLFLYELQPVDLERDGLVSILNQRLTAVEGRADVKARLLSDETISLPLDKEVALYYIAQEALNNVLKHAKAKSVTVRLKQTKSKVKLEIEDDGNGFTPGKDNNGGMGMRNMKERASQVGGKIAISSIPGKGTRICATVSKEQQSRIHLSGVQI